MGSEFIPGPVVGSESVLGPVWARDLYQMVRVQNNLQTWYGVSICSRISMGWELVLDSVCVHPSATNPLNDH